MLDFLLGADIAVMRMMHEEFTLVEQDTEAGAVRRLDRRAKVV